MQPFYLADSSALNFREKAVGVWAADAVGGEKRAGARGIDLGGSGT